MSATKPESSPRAGELPEWLKLVWRQVGSLRYGVVEIVVHDSQVTQIEKTERVRLDKPLPDTKPQAANKQIKPNNADRSTGSS